MSKAEGTYTEEDTFRTLKQTPFHQMRVLLIKSEGYSSDSEFLARHGWVVDEYIQHWNKWWNSESK